MVTVYDVEAGVLIRDAGVDLKNLKEIQKPEWAEIVKTGPGQERLPDDPDWWYYRAASVLRKVYTRGPIGVSKLRTYYGKKKNRGVRPEKFYKASGKIIRTVLQQLETAGYVQYKEKGVHKGRVITGKGQSFLDNVARKGFKDKGKASEAEA